MITQDELNQYAQPIKNCLGSAAPDVCLLALVDPKYNLTLEDMALIRAEANNYQAIGKFAKFLKIVPGWLVNIIGDQTVFLVSFQLWPYLPSPIKPPLPPLPKVKPVAKKPLPPLPVNPIPTIQDNTKPVPQPIFPPPNPILPPPIPGLPSVTPVTPTPASTTCNAPFQPMTAREWADKRKKSCIISSPISDNILTITKWLLPPSWLQEWSDNQLDAFVKFVAAKQGLSIANTEDIGVLWIPWQFPDVLSPIFGMEEIASYLASLEYPKLDIPFYEKIPSKIQTVTKYVNPSVFFDDAGLDYEKPCNMVEAAIPVRNFKNNLPSNIGYSRQLQILFDNKGREITIPNPKKGITVQNIRNVLTVATNNPNMAMPFGNWKCEVDLTFGYIRYYAQSENQGKFILYALATLSDETIIDKSFRASDKDRGFATEVLTPNRAIIFDKSISPNGYKLFML